MVSGDVAFRITYILAYIGNAAISLISLIFTGSVLDSMIAQIGEVNTMIILAAIAAILVFISVLLIVHYPAPKGAYIGLQVGVLSSVVLSTVLLTYAFGYTLPVYTSSLYVVLTLAYLDFFLLIMVVLVALFLMAERL